MIDIRPIAFVIGVLLIMLGGAMLLPAIVDIGAQDPEWRVFALSAGITVFFGFGLTFATRGLPANLNMQQAFLLTTLAWIVLPAFAALPFTLRGDVPLSYTDSFFEAMSGLTTTGSTVMTYLDYMPPGILFWRALLQWLGGVGIIVMAIAVLPMLQVGGMHLFRMESSDTSEKILPRAAQVAVAIASLYVAFTALCVAAYWAAGMTAFEAVAHAMTTIATGGFSTSDGSIGYFDSAAIDVTCIAFMVIGSLPFVIYLQMVRGAPLALWRDPQAKVFLALASAFIAAMTFYLVLTEKFAPADALRAAAFNVISAMTGTGYATEDYGKWGGFAVGGFFFIMFVGGCAGSTSCGIKIFRFQVLWAEAVSQLKLLLHPNGVFTPRYGGRPIPESVVSSVISFFFLFFIAFGALAAALSLTGVDFVTAVSGAATAMANVGPGLGPVIGPAGTFQSLEPEAKWLLSIGMLLGRLELFTVLVLFAPSFWRA